MLTYSELRAGHPAALEYLVNIFVIQRDYGYANNARLAQWMHVSRSAVSQAIGRLKTLSLINQDEYGGIRLSPEGRQIAESVLRRHYLIEHMLVRILDYPWDKADDEAGRIQETISDDFTDHLAEFLGNPQTCPHGNPFPGASIESSLVEAKKLSECTAGDAITVLRITEEGESVPGMLSTCYEHHISPGVVLEVLESGDDKLTLSDMGKGPRFQLLVKYARHIRVEPVE